MRRGEVMAEIINISFSTKRIKRIEAEPLK